MGDTNPESALKACLVRWGRPERPHVVADSAFGSVAMAEYITQWGGRATLASSTIRQTWMWNILSYNLPNGHWRAAVMNGFVFSVTCSVDPKGTLHYLKVITTAFRVEHTLAWASIEAADQGSSRMPVYLRAELQAVTLVDLRKICKKHNVKATGNKSTVIDAITTRSNTLNAQRSALQQVEQQLPAVCHPGMGPANSTYKQLFNSIDMVDRYHSRVKESHINQSWRSKFVLNILRCGIINSWVVTQTAVYYEWKSYRDNLIEEILSE
jgi:hypothetical protein